MALNNSSDREFYKGLNLSEDRIVEKKDWRGLFPEQVIRQAESAAVQNALKDFSAEREGYWGGERSSAFFQTGPENGETPVRAGRRQISYRYSFGASRRTGYNVFVRNAPRKLKDDWQNAQMSCSCPDGQKGMRCIHKAALLVRWEKEHGPWVVEESDEEYRSRMNEIGLAGERERRTKLRKETGMDEIPAAGFFRDRIQPEGLVFFDISKILEGWFTTPYYMARAGEVLPACRERSGMFHRDIQIDRSRDGVRTVSFDLSFEEQYLTGRARGSFLADRLLSIDTDEYRSGVFWYGRREKSPVEEKAPRLLDEYALAALSVTLDFLDLQTDLGRTDEAASRFFTRLERAVSQVQEENQPAAQQKRKILVIEPRITVEEGEAKLSFRLGQAGARTFVLRNLSQLVRAYQAEETFQLTKKESVDFSVQDFTDDAAPLLEFMIRRVGETRDVNAKLEEKARRGYASFALSEASSQMDLKGSLLDSFYDAAEGRSCEYQDKTNEVKGSRIRIGHSDMHFTLTLERLGDARGKFAGVTVSGFIPVLIRGRSAQYILGTENLSRVSAQEVRTLSPFTAVADPSGYFRFQVGLDRLQEFYYRVLPVLQESTFVEISDLCGEEAASYLTPEPDFSFFLDYEKGILYCRCRVTYGERNLILKPASGGGDEAREEDDTLTEPGSGEGLPELKHDTEQERRVGRVLREYFTQFSHRSNRYRKEMDEEEMFDFLVNGIPVLSRYGTVQGTDAFRRQKVRPVPQISVGVSVQSGIMDLSVTSRDVSREELLDILEGYQLRRRYHRLESGEYIDLSQSEGLDSVGALLSELDLLPKEVIREKAHLPAYRALYLDRLLEEHDALASTRDRTFRTLARNFRTVNDADFEIPETVAGILRPYQAFGYKWLKTLESSGFGGILADEMGLGKTLEMISLLLYDKEQEQAAGSLIICPASLVYNWQEEIRRFAPQLSCTVLAGTPAARKAALGRKADVYISSYDLIRRDIALFQDREFHICVLDEAQYIKNAKAAVTKAVKGIRSSHRFALTGTPIENRLAELWSIFDFLMPGFLYSLPEFGERFEKRITKEKDEKATARLRAMTSPFILRRRKSEVLKDLPAKLEEIRYARVTGEQQKLYDAQVLRMKGMLQESSGTGEDRIRIFAELTRIRQICCDPALLFEDYRAESAKREACLETIRSAIDGGHRMLVFSQFTSMLALLEEDLKKEGIEYYKITGSTPKERRLTMVHAFNEGTVPVFLISLKAGGAGLNLTGADVVIHYDPWWNLAAQNQATDRAHRIGQTRQVTVYKLLLKDTIEEKILELQNAKSDLAEAILEGEASSIMSMSNEELLALLS